MIAESISFARFIHHWAHAAGELRRKIRPG
jgi:hypothetical protein